MKGSLPIDFLGADLNLFQFAQVGVGLDVLNDGARNIHLGEDQCGQVGQSLCGAKRIDGLLGQGRHLVEVQRFKGGQVGARDNRFKRTQVPTMGQIQLLEFVQVWAIQKDLEAFDG